MQATRTYLELSRETQFKPGFGAFPDLVIERVEPEDLEGPAAHSQRGAAPEAVRRHQSTTLTFVTKYSVSPKQRVGRPLCCS